MTKNYSKNIADAINTYLKEDDWHYHFNESLGRFKFGVRLQGKLRTVDYYVIVHLGDYVVYAVSPIKVDPKDSVMLQKMSEFVCRANYGLNCGNFELDYNDGEIRYKCYVSCEGNVVPTVEIIRESIFCPASMFDRYTAGILGIIFQDREAKDAVDECENIKKEVQNLLERIDNNGGKRSSAIARVAERLGIPMGDDADDAETSEQDAHELDEEMIAALTDLLDDLEDDDSDQDENT